ncbi:class I adenylate-forming enzyme family protein [Curtobacterium sp. NPDC090217]|uniref:class I adenylate-forming enzyme family protein n=1 Tax=Curtobacterium sp. NPDC090217 TaxID=3363970 RepID=UPI003810EE0A
MTLALHKWIDEAEQLHGSRRALEDAEMHLTYSQLADVSRRWATVLRDHGVRRGDRVMLILPNSVDVLICCYAASRLGATFVVINPEMKPFHVSHVLENAAPTLVIAAQPPAKITRCGFLSLRLLRFAGDAAAPLCAPWPSISSDPACLVYTSGTTSMPKGVVEPHKSILFAVDAINAVLQIRKEDVIGCFLPLSFDYGLYQAFLAASTGACLVVGDPGQVGPMLPTHLKARGITVLPLVPSMASVLVRLAVRSANSIAPGLRMITNTGAALPARMIDDLRNALPEADVFSMFGLTECKRTTIMRPEEFDGHRESVGRALPDTECFVVDGNGEPLPPGEVGELVVRGPHVMQGYWRASAESSLRFRSFGEALEIALFTGDQCYLDEDGYLYFEGRLDDIYKQNGYRVSALEIEAAAREVAIVAEAVVLAPDGQEPAALVVITDQHNVQAREVVYEVTTGLRARLEEAKLPRRVEILDRLPLSTNGKVDRGAVRALLNDARGREK